ncbi:translocation and assembly module lipoprotein TamL [Desertivirga xinjiangensis]|uniref:translocation and assembly module lipoprotein TamL n=1 Tax=Desertivirga xinjiangensis TaxID=539206 RepID=UPI00210EE831|nr:BamA/TamA family outer membrane protein [Pedobacter xinjiangensis]
MSKRSIYFILIPTLIVAACSSTKYVPEGDYLYTGASVKIEDKNIKKRESKALSGELEGVLRPRPNSRFLGIPFKLWIYNSFGNPKKEKGLGNKIRNKFGQPPVLFSSVKVDYNRDLVQNRLENRGYFRAEVTADSSVKKKTASLTYTAIPGPQYMINSVRFATDSSSLGKALVRTSRRSFLKVGESYDLDVIKSERTRIDNRLKEKGFYYFSPDHILIQVDSSNNQQKVDLVVNVKESMPEKAKQVFNIENIYIYPNYNLADDSLSVDYGKPYKDFIVVDSTNLFKPQVFERTMFFHKGDIYNRTDHNMSLNRLVNLGTFKFVKNKFVETADSEDNKLDTYYYLSPYPKKSLRAELLGRNTSANFNGTEINISWRNRNAFRGAELLTINAYAGTDIQVSGVNQGNNLLRFGAEANLNIPKLISPFKFNASSAFIPRTKIMLGYDFLNRRESYALNSFRTSFGYVWKEDVKREHQLNIFAVNYVQPANVTPAYSALATPGSTFAKAIEKQFIIGPNYNFLYTNTVETRKKNTFYENFNIDLSGNILGLAMGANYKDGDTVQFLGARFSQYVKIENDFRHYFNLGYGSQIASRLITGYGLAYGNSSSLPFIKQFFIGGTNSLRAFRARSLGPGTTNPVVDRNAIAPDRTGDIKLEFNTEYRPKFNNILRGALFIDAGNIWLLNEDPQNPQPGATFSKEFLSELAVGTGVGLRFDLSFFVLRTDLAFPIRKPWLPKGERWVFNDIDFSRDWRKENLVFNLAIGYPF